MEEMLYDYKSYASKVSNEEYQENEKIIRDLKDIAYEITKIDTLTISSKEEIEDIIHQFIFDHSLIQAHIGLQEDRLVRLVRETYLMDLKILQYENNSFDFLEKNFIVKRIWYGWN